MADWHKKRTTGLNNLTKSSGRDTVLLADSSFATMIVESASTRTAETVLFQRLRHRLVMMRYRFVPTKRLIQSVAHGGTLGATHTVIEALRERLALQDGSLAGGDFRGASLEGALLAASNLAGARFAGAKLRGAYFAYSDLRSANFAGADLRDCNFRQAQLTGVDFTGADLRGANFARAKLTDARLAQADLRGANFWGAELTELDHEAEPEAAGLRSNEPETILSPRSPISG